MHDRVAEILDERAALTGSTSAGVALSLALHAAIIGGAVYAALQQPSAEPARVLSIRFAQPVAAPAAAKPRRKPVERAATIQPPQPKVIEPKPAAKPEKGVPMSPFGRSEKRGSENPPAPAPRAAAPTTDANAPSIDVPVGGAGVAELEGGDFPYTLYIERMKTLIGNNWLRPEVRGGISTMVYFVINRDGTIREAKTEQSSGNGTFDRAALRAVLEASPLPPLPFGYNGTYLGVHLIFK